MLGEVQHGHQRLLDVDLRVGSMALDNSHRQRGLWGGRKHHSVALPIDGHVQATERAIWRVSDDAYRQASEQIARIRANLSVQVEEEDDSPDFSPAEPHQEAGTALELGLDLDALKADLIHVSKVFSAFPDILESKVALEAQNDWVHFVSSEGASLAYPRRSFRILMHAWLRGEDGTRLSLFEAFDALNPEHLPNRSLLEERAQSLAERLLELEQAPELEPFSGPIILGGKAAGVFFHEVLGHRVEGHRQKDELEGQTFTAKVGEAILPSFLSIRDDPRVKAFNEVELVGHYAFDDEGLPSEAVLIVEDGILKNFLLSRSPIAGFPQSNGHGRRQPGKAVVSRQGSLMVEASERMSEGELRASLLQEIRRQGKAFGLFVDSIQGGFTLTGRDAPNSFQVTPDYAWKVFADGRPDELVRGVDLIGTPLVSFSRILAAGGEVEVFNGRCGAESGWIPVSATSPSILLSEIEIQKKQKGSKLPPIMAPPIQGEAP
jgi:predicted Zn-dependent protease